MPRNREDDLRVQRSRQFLYEALIQLIHEKPYAQITIAELTERAQVARQTFYLHYKDKDELLLSSVELLFGRLTAEFEANFQQDVDSGPQMLCTIFEQIQAHHELFRVILSGDAGSVMLIRFRSYAKRILQTTMQDGLALNPLDASTLEIVADYLAGAFTQMVNGWLARDMSPAPLEMSHIFYQLTEQGVGAVLNIAQARPRISTAQ